MNKLQEIKEEEDSILDNESNANDSIRNMKKKRVTNLSINFKTPKICAKNKTDTEGVNKHGLNLLKHDSNPFSQEKYEASDSEDEVEATDAEKEARKKSGPFESPDSNKNGTTN